MTRDIIGTRMKTYYESVSQTRLTRRTPVIIRIDGNAFHTFTKRLQKPFDPVFLYAMNETMFHMCKELPGCALAYVQSDEISFLMIDYHTLNYQPYFDYRIQKICSITAAKASVIFNRKFAECVNNLLESGKTDTEKAWLKACEKTAVFDCRAFNIPKEEVANYFYWRQTDAMRNSVQSCAHKQFSQKEIHGKSTEQMKEMLTDTKYDWNKMTTAVQRGRCCKKDENGKWYIDYDIPVFTETDRSYIENLVFI